mgnify:CR=1 FL=1
MTDEEALDLGRRFAACKGFRPMRGMLDNHGRTWTPDLLWRWTPKVDIPDLRDPATRGCALALVREAWGDPAICVVLDTSDGRWCAGRWEDGLAMRGRGGATEAEALIAALEAAPKRGEHRREEER